MLTILPTSQSGPTPLIELLWHERSVEVFGTLHRITVPVVGSDGTTVPVESLAAELTSRWVGRPALSPSASITSVAVELRDHAGGRALVLVVTADALPHDHSVVNTRMVRDLRRALRDLRRFGGVPHGSGAGDELAAA